MSEAPTLRSLAAELAGEKPGRLPDPRAVSEILDLLYLILFPALCRNPERASQPPMLRKRLTLVEKLLQVQVDRVGRDAEIHRKSIRLFLAKLPAIRAALREDFDAAFEGDPAASHPDEILLSYPFAEAVMTYRMAHELYLLEVPMLPRMMSERAHRHTGIDIHPGARIGRRFFIDHGTGVVIGETCEIGDRVKIYHGVTLGAKSTYGGQSLRGKKRHPSIEDDVTIYPGATILGGDVVIGKGSTIGGSVWLIESVPAESRIQAAHPENIFTSYGRRAKKTPRSF